MSDLVLLNISQELEQIRHKVAGKAVSVVFDGTTRLARQWL